MTNVEQYLNRGKTCATIPRKVSEYLQVDKFLSEYDTDEEKKIAMQNLLLLDENPTEGSTKLLTSGVIFRVLQNIYNSLNNKVNSSDVQNIVRESNRYYEKEEINQRLQELQNIINNIKISLNDLTEEEINSLKGKSAYEIYLETVPEGETPMSKEEWISSQQIDYSVLNNYATTEYVNQYVNSAIDAINNNSSQDDPSQGNQTQYDENSDFTLNNEKTSIFSDLYTLNRYGVCKMKVLDRVFNGEPYCTINDIINMGSIFQSEKFITKGTSIISTDDLRYQPKISTIDEYPKFTMNLEDPIEISSTMILPQEDITTDYYYRFSEMAMLLASITDINNKPIKYQYIDKLLEDSNNSLRFKVMEGNQERDYYFYLDSNINQVNKIKMQDFVDLLNYFKYGDGKENGPWMNL